MHTHYCWPMHPTALLFKYQQQERVSHYTLDPSFMCLLCQFKSFRRILFEHFICWHCAGLPLVGFWDRRETPSSEPQPAPSFSQHLPFKQHTHDFLSFMLLQCFNSINIYAHVSNMSKVFSLNAT